ncbi:MAG: hypothetical protein ACE5E7_00700 [Anaerolineae bacterium]
MMDPEPTEFRLRYSGNPLLTVGGCLMVFICLGITGIMGMIGLLIWVHDNGPILADRAATATAVALVDPEVGPDPVAPATPAATGTQIGNGALPSEIPPPTVSAVPTTPPDLLNIFPPASIEQQPVPPRAAGDLVLLFETNYPQQDYFDSANRLGRKGLRARTIIREPYAIGARHLFHTDEGDVEAVLVSMTESAYFWVDTLLEYDEQVIHEAAKRLESEIYPRLVNLSGQEWRPGVDNDPHFSILHLARSTNASELGYFTDVDEYPAELYSDSNEQELVYLIMGPLEFGSDLYYGTLIHEIQHMVQWYVDPNEATWMDEGLSQLAELYVGLDTASTWDYLQRPDTPLNTWNYDENEVDAHYSAAYLYLVYLWEQLGETAVRELSRHPANGMAAVRAVLGGYQPDWSLERFTADWMVANWLDDPAAGPRYYYRDLDLRQPAVEVRARSLPFELEKELDQFAVHYIDLDFRGPATITFAGDTVAALIDAPPRSGEQFWLAPPMNGSSAQLTAAFDLTGLEQATLKFSAWYDLEEEFDFAYVSISGDGGVTWDILTPDHRSVGEFGPAFNGRSDQRRDAVDGWLKETIPLGAFVGQPVLIRFEVLTDSAVTGRGFAIDDIAIPELSYTFDEETGVDDWEARGFVHTGWLLPQQWAIRLIEGGPSPQVTALQLNSLNQGQMPIEIGKGGGVLAIMPLTPFTNASAGYWLRIDP